MDCATGRMRFFGWESTECTMKPFQRLGHPSGSVRTAERFKGSGLIRCHASPSRLLRDLMPSTGEGPCKVVFSASGLIYRGLNYLTRERFTLLLADDSTSSRAIATPYKFRGSLAINYLVGCSCVQCNSFAQCWNIFHEKKPRRAM